MAALLVVLFHLGHFVDPPEYFGAAFLGRLFLWGDAAVPLFFVLSGFLIPWIHLDDFNRPRRLWNYLRKRTLRVYPVYWLVFAAAAGAAAFMPVHRTIVLPTEPVVVIKGLLLIAQDHSIVHGSAPVLVQAWTMNFEILFYALIAVFIFRTWLGSLLVVMLAVNVVECHHAACAFPRSFLASPYLALFALGAAVAWLMRRGIRLPRPGATLIVSIGLFLGLGITESLLGHHVAEGFRAQWYGATSALLIWSAVQRETDRPLRAFPALEQLGDASYALYLVHLPLIEALCELAQRLGLTRTSAVGAIFAYLVILSVCIGAGWLVHRWVERPLLNRLSRHAPAQAIPVTSLSA